MRPKFCLLVLLCLLAPHQPVLCVHQQTKPQPVHYLVRLRAWHFLSLMGCLGTLLNGLLFYTFYNCENMATSVNAMIFMETFYSMVYIIIGMHWRTCSMVYETACFSNWFNKEEVISTCKQSGIFFLASCQFW